MNLSCSELDLRYLETALRYVKERILFDLSKNELKDLFTYEYLHYDFFEKEVLPNIINKKNDKKLIVIDNEERCKGNVWKNGKLSRCKKKFTEGSDFCFIHNKKRNYGSIKTH